MSRSRGKDHWESMRVESCQGERGTSGFTVRRARIHREEGDSLGGGEVRKKQSARPVAADTPTATPDVCTGARIGMGDGACAWGHGFPRMFMRIREFRDAASSGRGPQLPLDVCTGANRRVLRGGFRMASGEPRGSRTGPSALEVEEGNAIDCRASRPVLRIRPRAAIPGTVRAVKYEWHDVGS